jgi:hypothetical protein
MARKRGSRIWETDTITGTGSFSLDGAVSGYRAFSAICANNDTVEYYATNRSTPTEYEYGIGTWTTGNNLARTTILESSNAGAVVSFGAGTKDIFLAPAPRSEEALIMVAISDEATAITTGTAKITMHAPFDFTLEDVIAGLTAVSTSGLPAFDINKAGASIFATTLTIDANEETSITATTAYNFTASAARIAFAKGDKITIDIDTAGTGAKGAKIYMLGYRGHD